MSSNPLIYTSQKYASENKRLLPHTHKFSFFLQLSSTRNQKSLRENRRSQPRRNTNAIAAVMCAPTYTVRIHNTPLAAMQLTLLWT